MKRKKERPRKTEKEEGIEKNFNLRACISEQFSFTRGPNAHDGH